MLTEHLKFPTWQADLWLAGDQDVNLDKLHLELRAKFEALRERAGVWTGGSSSILSSLQLPVNSDLRNNKGCC